MKILHSADWHLDSPLSASTQDLKKHLLALPGRIAALAREERCDMVLLSGDLFDGPASREGLDALKAALEEIAVPVFIAPGNHDFCGAGSPWLTEIFPKNVHVFTKPVLEALSVPGLDCRVYGAGYESMDCPPLLSGFRAECQERYAVCVLHGDPMQLASPYCPITAEQVRESGLDYLALGHIHKGGSFRAGGTLCAWPGCPMGRGYDELGQKGVLIVTLEDTAQTRFVPLDMPQFHDLEIDAGTDPDTILPPVGNEDHYRVTFTGESDGLDLAALGDRFSRFPNLELRDRTVPPVDLWASAGDDTLEGVYFRMLRDALEDGDEKTRERVRLAAKLSRQLLNGQEVKLP